MNECSEELEIDLRRVFCAIWRGKWAIALAALLCGGAVLLGMFLFVTPLYRSSVMFYAEGAPAESAEVILLTGETLDAVAAEAGTARSREELAEMLSAQTVDGQTFLEVTAAAPDAGEAKAIADAVARVLPRRTAEVVAGASLKVADVPVAARKPSSPDCGKNALMGAAAALALTAGGIALGEIFREDPAGKYECKDKGKRRMGR